MITCIDSGEWASAPYGLSAPRVYTPIREMGANGQLQIDTFQYIESPILDTPFPDEDDAVYKLRHDARRAVEKERVRLTAKNFGIRFQEFDFEDRETALSPIVCVNVRPGSEKSEDQSTDESELTIRNRLLEVLLKRSSVKRILLAPPYFSNTKELAYIKRLDAEKKIVLWTPYRYSAGIIYARTVLQQDTALGGGSLIVISGPFLIRRFISEFALPFLDTYLSLTGAVLREKTQKKSQNDEALKLSIELSAPNGLPVFSISAKHESGAISSILLSTAGAGFQNIDHVTVKLLMMDMTHIDLSSSLTLYNHRTPDRHFSNGVSHDPPRSALNGSRYLVNACLSESEKDLPTLSSFNPTQEVIDALLREVQRHELQ